MASNSNHEKQKYGQGKSHRCPHANLLLPQPSNEREHSKCSWCSERTQGLALVLPFPAVTCWVRTPYCLGCVHKQICRGEDGAADPPPVPLPPALAPQAPLPSDLTGRGHAFSPFFPPTWVYRETCSSFLRRRLSFGESQQG